jgi:hypothetical protein
MTSAAANAGFYSSSVTYHDGKFGCWGFKQGSLFANWKKRWFVLELGVVIQFLLARHSLLMIVSTYREGSRTHANIGQAPLNSRMATHLRAS